jgi:hypothetical protein
MTYEPLDWHEVRSMNGDLAKPWTPIIKAHYYTVDQRLVKAKQMATSVSVCQVS